MAKIGKSSAEHILPLYMNGLAGRMLRLPAKGKYRREILLIYGHHSSIERMIGLAEYLNKYGSVTMPDIPGFGGMQPFYKIGQKPTLDALADYLAAFVKLRYRNRRITLVGLSFGFTVITHMLQKYPDIARKTDLAVSVFGFAHRDDFIFSRRRYWLFRGLASVLSTRFFGAFFKYAVLRPAFIRNTYKIMENRNPKLKGATIEEKTQRIEFEIKLWRINDPRTWTETGLSMLKLVPGPNRIDLPVHHIATKNDRYFDNLLVEQHMRTIFNDFYIYTAKMPTHAPSMVASAKELAPLVPPKLRTVLRRGAPSSL